MATRIAAGCGAWRNGSVFPRISRLIRRNIGSASAHARSTARPSLLDALMASPPTP